MSRVVLIPRKIVDKVRSYFLVKRRVQTWRDIYKHVTLIPQSISLNWFNIILKARTIAHIKVHKRMAFAGTFVQLQ